MKVLVLNAGSSSLKFELYAMPAESVLASGLVERIGEVVPDHAAALTLVLDALCDGEGAPLTSLSEIGAVGHRVVHGGEDFASTVLITPEVIAALTANIPLAPLHNPPNLLGIQVAREALPGVPQVAVFDTAFHQTLPPRAFLYALPRALYAEHRIRRYGFHGTSHRYVAGRAAALLGRSPEELNLITCHLGNGASLCAIEGGRSVDTTMGLTPLEGVVMGTRCGDLDPAIPLFLQRELGMSVDDVDRLLNKRSGLLGLSGRSNDLRVIEEAAAAGDAAAEEALDVYCYRLRKAIGATTAALGRVDALVFTAGVGENSSLVRARALEGLAPLGYALDAAKNAGLRGREADITGAGSRARILVIPTDEELMIARDTYALARG
ncbi:MAG: acetate kinase [Pseudomonadota bacterium]